MNVSVYLHDTTARAQVVGHPNKPQQFIVIYLEELAIYFAGFDEENAAAVRALADVLDVAADELDMRVEATRAATPVS